ncbi:hypothetical protein [Paraburkholderia susongensis]|nr:hypothetical protein [Paraburkholderia susongensis]
MTDASLKPITAAEVEQLEAQMNETGVGVLRDVISDSLLQQARGYVKAQLEQRGGQYFGLRGPEWIAQSPLDTVFRSEAFATVLTSLYEKAMGTQPPSDRILPVIRVVAGTLGLRHSNLFHYDSFVVTALVPIVIPSRPDELPGHLVMYPNLRKVRRRAVVNIAEKLFVESATARRLWRSPWLQHRLGAQIVKLEPGNIYFFWGMRSLHANQACLAESVRSTVLFHFGDPHEKSVFKQYSRRLSELRTRRIAGKEHRARDRRYAAVEGELPRANPDN